MPEKKLPVRVFRWRDYPIVTPLPAVTPTTLRYSAHPVSGADYAFSGSAEADAQACAGAWPKVLAFLDEAAAEGR